MPQIKLTRKIQPLSHLITLLIITRIYVQQLPLLIFTLLVVSLIMVKHFTQGNTIQIIGQVISLCIFMIGEEIFQENYICKIGLFIAVINYVFIAPTIYKLPQFSSLVGLREGVKRIKNSKPKNELYWTQWYPVQEDSLGSQQKNSFKIKWAHTTQVKTIATYIRIDKNIFAFNILKFITSGINKYELKFSKKPEQKTKNIMLFSHGRTATPFLYSSFFIPIAKTWKIFAPQHSQKGYTQLKEINLIKKFRQNEVKQRASDLLNLTSNLPSVYNLTLMGHSYGCSTLLQAYHQLHLSVRKNIKGLILLDPWLFPLKDQLLKESLGCYVLMLANQRFIAIEDVFTRNKKFIKENSSNIIYICWKDADHIQQTDMPFTLGTTAGVIKNIKNSHKVLQNNIEAIQIFLQFLQNEDKQKKISTRFEECKIKILSKFNDENLGQNYVPKKWKTKFTF